MAVSRLCHTISILWDGNVLHMGVDGTDNQAVANSANAGTASYAHYPSHAVGLADFGLRGNYISSASPSGGNDGDTWDKV